VLPAGKKWLDAKADASFTHLFPGRSAFCQDERRRTTTGTAIASLLIGFPDALPAGTDLSQCPTFTVPGDVLTVGDLVRMHRQLNTHRMETPISSVPEAGVADTASRETIIRLVQQESETGKDTDLSKIAKLAVHTDLVDIDEESIKERESFFALISRILVLLASPA
jgi:hypothetical protein